jgi:hypothetical protein
MNLQRRVLVLLTLAGLMGGGLFVGLQERTMAQAPDIEDEIIVANPLVDCSTNMAYNDPINKEVYTAVGGPQASNSQCNACHQNAHPVPGQGDRPRAKQSTVLVMNKTAEPVRFEMKVGNKSEWTEVELKPRQIFRRTFPYTQINQNKSPQFFVRYEDDPENKARKVYPMATPNPKIGSVYFFEQDNQGQVKLYTPKSWVSRVRR